MAVSSDRNTSLKVIEKLSKYKDLEIEISNMWGMKTETVPVVVGALGVIRKGIYVIFRKYYTDLCSFGIINFTKSKYFLHFQEVFRSRFHIIICTLVYQVNM